MRRDLAGNEVCLCRMLPDRSSMVPVPAAGVNKWELDEKPQGGQSNERAKRQRCAGRLSPYEEIEHENGAEE